MTKDDRQRSPVYCQARCMHAVPGYGSIHSTAEKGEECRDDLETDSGADHGDRDSGSGCLCRRVGMGGGQGCQVAATGIVAQAEAIHATTFTYLESYEREIKLSTRKRCSRSSTAMGASRE